MAKFSAVKNVSLVLLVLTGVFTSCKKDKNVKSDDEESVQTPNDVSPETGTRTQLTKDSIFLYARQVYLWWDEIPDYQTFSPRQYSGFETELYALTRYGINSSTNKPFELSLDSDGKDDGTPKYSYISDITQRNAVAVTAAKKSSIDLQGNGNDFGIRAGLAWLDANSTKYGVVLYAVYPNSPAAKAGLERGDIITNINDRDIGNYTEEEILFLNNALFNATSISVKGMKVNSTSNNIIPFRASFSAISYASSPILKDSVYVSGNKKIGYMAYARFSNLENDSKEEFDKVFKKFATQGVTDLIIDLRYNGGGYVSSAEYLANLIAPTTLEGKVMFTEHYNKLMQAGKADILKKQLILNSLDQSTDSNNDGKPDTYADVDFSVAGNTQKFDKKGTLNNVSNVVFIISGATASASELVINALKPHMNVKIVGERSYGKPVGFSPIRIDKYDVYLSMFESKNSLDEGGYFDGIAPTTGSSTADDDNPFYGFGDVRESSFKAAYNYLTKGTFTSSSTTTSSVSTRGVRLLNDANSLKLSDRDFKGMIEDRFKLK
jgi:carboxyl-terminal processing protease